MLSKSMLKVFNFKPLVRVIHSFKNSIATRFHNVNLCVEDAPSFRPEYEYLFQQLIANRTGNSDPFINEMNKHINYGLFSFGVIHSTKSVRLGGYIRFNNLGLIVPDNDISELELSVSPVNSYKVSGQTLNLILSHFVWKQMLINKRNVKFAKYMLERIQIAYGYILSTQPNSVNSYIYTHFKLMK